MSKEEDTKYAVENSVYGERKRIETNLERLYYGNRRFMISWKDIVDIIHGKAYEDLRDDNHKRNVDDEKAEEELGKLLHKKEENGEQLAYMVDIADELDIPTSQAHRILQKLGYLKEKEN